MIAYLIVDVDALLQRLDSRGVTLDIHTVAAALINSAVLAAGLQAKEDLSAVAVADWNRYRRPSGSAGVSVQQVFASEGYDLFNVPDRSVVADALLKHYFSIETAQIDELIVASTRDAIVSLVPRVDISSRTRVRIWGDDAATVEDDPLCKRYHRFMQHMMASGYNHINSVQSCGM